MRECGKFTHTGCETRSLAPHTRGKAVFVNVNVTVYLFTAVVNTLEMN